MFPSLRRLDEVQHLAQLDAFDPRPFLTGVSDEAAALAAETLDDLGALLDGVREVLVEIDRFAQKSMRIRLTQELATDPLPQPLRNLLTSTVVSYERDLGLLRGRVAGALARIDRATADEVTDRVLEAAERVLAGRAALRQGVLQLVERLVTDKLPSVQRAARDRSQPDEQRKRWGQARVDLERLTARPDALEAGSFAERLRQIPPPPDEPDPEPTASRFSLLEID
jgi:hypothetical protein